MILHSVKTTALTVSCLYLVHSDSSVDTAMALQSTSRAACSTAARVNAITSARQPPAALATTGRLQSVLSSAASSDDALQSSSDSLEHNHRSLSAQSRHHAKHSISATSHTGDERPSNIPFQRRYDGSNRGGNVKAHQGSSRFPGRARKKTTSLHMSTSPVDAEFGSSYWRRMPTYPISIPSPISRSPRNPSRKSNRGGGRSNKRRAVPSSVAMPSPTRKQARSATPTDAIRRLGGNLRSLKNAVPVEWAVAVTYFCTAAAIQLPTTLVPMIGQEAVSKAALTGTAAPSVTSFVAQAASIAILGGGSGKIFNGLVTQTIHPKKIANWYLLVLSGCLVALSAIPTNPTVAGVTIGGLEFVGSALWATCSVTIARHFIKAGNGQAPTPENKQKFARAITLLSLSATSGQVFGKMVLGTFLLPFFHWRNVARYGSILPLMAWTVSQIYFPSPSSMNKRRVAKQRMIRTDSSKRSHGQVPSNDNLLQIVRKVIGKPLFWMVGMAHIAGYLARTSDRIMGPFLYELTGMSHSICAGMTAALTLGFVHGLSRAPALLELPTVEQQSRKLRTNYFRSVASVLGLALCAAPQIQSTLLPHPYLRAAAIVLCSASFTSNLAFAFFQVPNLMSSSSVFSEQKAMTLCFLDGMGFFLTAPLWVAFGKIISSFGWTAMWSTLAGIVALCGSLMIPSTKSMLAEQQEQK